MGFCAFWEERWPESIGVGEGSEISKGPQGGTWTRVAVALLCRRTNHEAIGADVFFLLIFLDQIFKFNLFYFSFCSVLVSS